MSKQDLRLDKQICHRLYMAHNTVTKAYRPLLAELGLTYPQYLVMMALWQHEKLLVAELQAETQIDAGALTQILKKLKDKGFLDLVLDKSDKRKKHVQLTISGAALSNAAESIPSKLRCQFPSLSGQDSETLITLLDHLIQDQKAALDDK